MVELDKRWMKKEHDILKKFLFFELYEDWIGCPVEHDEYVEYSVEIKFYQRDRHNRKGLSFQNKMTGKIKFNEKLDKNPLSQCNKKKEESD